MDIFRGMVTCHFEWTHKGVFISLSCLMRKKKTLFKLVLDNTNLGLTGFSESEIPAILYVNLFHCTEEQPVSIYLH